MHIMNSLTLNNQRNVGMGESASRYGCFPDAITLLYSAIDCFLIPWSLNLWSIKFPNIDIFVPHLSQTNCFSFWWTNFSCFFKFCDPLKVFWHSVSEHWKVFFGWTFFTCIKWRSYPYFWILSRKSHSWSPVAFPLYTCEILV